MPAKKYPILVLIISFLFSTSIYSQNSERKLGFKKTIDDADCNECRLEKKNNSCFMVASYIKNVTLTNSRNEELKELNETDNSKKQQGKANIFHFCTTDGYQEITVSAPGLASITFVLTPADFKQGMPIVTLYEQGNEPETEVLLENEFESEKENPKRVTKAEKRLFMQKNYDNTECDYCLKVNKNYKCLIVITGLKGGKLMDGEERIKHTKVLKFQDTIKQYVFCFRPDRYAQFTFKARGYENGIVEVIPHDFTRNRTPMYTFYDETQKEIFEGETKEPVKFLYSKKSINRWECKDCESKTPNTSCVYLYSDVSDLVLNTENGVLKPASVKSVSPLLNQYVFCVNPNTKTLMAGHEGYEPCLLKAKFEDLESVGGTAFVVSSEESGLDLLLESAEEFRHEPIKIGTKATTEKGREYRLQLVAKILDDATVDKIQNHYQVPAEIKEDYDGNWHRFTFGSFAKYEDAVKALSEFKKKNKTNDAFIVLYVDGKRVGPYNP